MARSALKQDPLQPLGVYIHIPFCRVHCPYCDFYTYPAHRGRDVEFCEALHREIELLDSRFDPARFQVETVYLGGGTPSTLGGGQVEELLSRLRSRLQISPEAEVTLEANPEDVEPERVRAWGQVGLNRISLGVQSLDSARLSMLGRVHTAATALAALRLISRLPNWSADLMFGWEGQTVRQLRSEVERLLEFSPPHVSLYQLTLEPRTRFGILASRNLMRCADFDHQADLYLSVCELLESAGLKQYEVSNFARQGFESRHNQAYWERRPYAGLGPSAASFLNHRRTKNAASLPRYLAMLRSRTCPVEFVELLSPRTEATERLWLGLRTSKGVPAEWITADEQPTLEAASQQGLVTTGAVGRIVLTRKGMALADEVVGRLLPTTQMKFS